ncbi:hypothetical protein DMA11_03350 [Marinilabiliaceae bacterium JC017]|nr:hypothetical protein DMA11_03350 [Marinilabiliaceae bacterium JC017]
MVLSALINPDAGKIDSDCRDLMILHSKEELKVKKNAAMMKVVFFQTITIVWEGIDSDEWMQI